jgi:hypothetical protein
MDAHQMLCHLADGFRMALGEKPVRPVGGLFHRTLLRWFALYAPLRWPPGVRTVRELDQQREGSSPGLFAADRAELLALLERFTDPGAHLKGRAHPVFGPLSADAWRRWGYLHADHHLRQFGS